MEQGGVCGGRVGLEGASFPQLITQSWERWGSSLPAGILTGEEDLWVVMKFVLRSNTQFSSQVFLPAMLRKHRPLSMASATRSASNQDKLPQILSRAQHMVSRVMWGASPKTKELPWNTESRRTHTWHGNQQPYKDKLETTISFQCSWGGWAKPASSVAGSQATAVKLGHCAVLTSSVGDSNQYSP